MKLISAALNRHQWATGNTCYFSAVIHSYELWCPVNVDESFQDRDNVIPTHGPFYFDGESFFAEVISDVEILQHPAVTGLMELEVQSPQMIRTRSAKPVVRVRGLP